MANLLVINAASRDLMCDDLVDLLDAGPAEATLQIYTIPRPADPDAAATGTLLAVCTYSLTAFGASTGGTATANAIADETSAPAPGGTAAWFRSQDSNTNGVFDGEVGLNASGSDLELNTLTISEGVIVSILSQTMTMPSGA